MGGATVSSRLASKILAGVRVLGADTRALIATVGLDATAVANRDDRVPHDVVVALLREAARALRDDALGLHLAELVHRSADNVLRIAVNSSLRGGIPKMDEVARKLHMSARTLQRRLQDDGLSFQDLVAEVRRDLSARYLEEADMSLAEVAFLIGFSEVSTFHRAFKQWTGLTPAEYRRRGPSPAP
jgi:AraC-like DNA-binding protein